MHDTSSLSAPLDRVRAALGRLNAELLALTPGPTLTSLLGISFHAHERVFLVLVPRKGTIVALVPALEADAWRASITEDSEVVPWDDAHGYAAALAEAARHLPPANRVAIEPQVMRVFEQEALLRLCPGAKTVDGSAVVAELRARKDAAAIEDLRKAAQITETALEELVAGARIGMTERQLAGRLTALLLHHGGHGIPWDPIVLSGPNAALPHGIAGERPLAAGDWLLVDCGTTYRGYHSDITRTFIAGAAPTEAQAALYDAVLQANERGRAACQPGATAHQVHHAAQDPFYTPAFAGYFKHRTGHGVGLDIHEPPSIMHGNREPLVPGMVFTVEPGLYKAGEGGVRIEDMVLITEDGSEALTTYPRALRVIAE